MTPPLPLEEAQARLLDAADPLGSETIPVEDAAGRRLAAPLVARRTHPWADLSAMDGFAVAGNGPWRIIGESAAGHPFIGSLAPGEATRISTGAAMPQGADAILLIEDSGIQGDSLVADDAPSDRHIRRAGFDFRAESALLSTGTRLGPAQLALAIMGGAATVDVARLPNVAIIDTGDELATRWADDRPDRLPASNGPMLAAMCAGFVAGIDRIGPVPDDRAALHTAFESAGAADVIVTTGGASVGEHDLVRPVLEQWGAHIEFWRVAIRPGKPLLVGRRGAQWMIGLPGNPASAFVTAMMFLLPLLRTLAGLDRMHSLPRAVTATLCSALPHGGKRREFVRGVLKGGSVTPIPERDSSALRALATANCLIDRANDAVAINEGGLVTVYPFDGA